MLIANCCLTYNFLLYKRFCLKTFVFLTNDNKLNKISKLFYKKKGRDSSQLINYDNVKTSTNTKKCFLQQSILCMHALLKNLHSYQESLNQKLKWKHQTTKIYLLSSWAYKNARHKLQYSDNILNFLNHHSFIRKTHKPTCLLEWE